ncbi:MAG: hypothetical protein QM739_09830 [Propionivibrio sp.]
MLKRCLLLIPAVLSACTYYVAQPVAPDPNQAQAAADAQCAKSGKAAVLIKPANCSGNNCTTTFECR